MDVGEHLAVLAVEDIGPREAVDRLQLADARRDAEDAGDLHGARHRRLVPMHLTVDAREKCRLTRLPLQQMHHRAALEVMRARHPFAVAPDLDVEGTRAADAGALDLDLHVAARRLDHEHDRAERILDERVDLAGRRLRLGTLADPGGDDRRGRLTFRALGVRLVRVTAEAGGLVEEEAPAATPERVDGEVVMRLADRIRGAHEPRGAVAIPGEHGDVALRHERVEHGKPRGRHVALPPQLEQLRGQFLRRSRFQPPDPPAN